ncbi:uncharacterized protein LOC129573399 [Sitodiplosis mosellana]|uniref:uncharacterized protein LOC129573399 n=1 Tax=Sitodiplosis mosellana TaxID=263140 RepID=UPI002443C0A3|nr:uncharacterized protein LOC129573399 [Sitodiplosis mosellana]
MEAGQLSSCLNWKCTGKDMCCIAIAFGFGFIAFFAIVSLHFFVTDTKLEIKIFFILLIHIFYLAASILWLIGTIKNKTYYLLAALVWFGISLNLTIGLVFYGIFLKTSPDSICYPYYLRDLQIFAATAFFVAFYFVIIMIYISMSRVNQTSAPKSFAYVTAWNFDWEVAGTAVGYMIIVLSIGQPSFFVFFNLFSETRTCVVVTVIFVFNLLMTIHWLYGIALRHTGFMFTAVVWYLLVLTLWLYVTIYTIYDRMSKGKALYQPRDHSLYAVTAIGIILYSIAVTSYESMKRENRRRIQEIQRFDQVFMLAPTDHKEFEV